jgi:hypothetical protein
MRALSLLFIILLITSCTSYKRCVNKFGDNPKDTVYYPVWIEIPVAIESPADSENVTADFDTLKPGVIYTNDEDSSGIIVQYWKDMYSQLLKINAKKSKEILRDTVRLKETIPCPPAQVLTKKESFFKSLINDHSFLILGLVFMFFFILIIRR